MEVKTFNNLSVDEQFDLLNKYYNQGIGAEKLVSEYGLSIRSSQLIGMFPPEETSDVCECCGGRIVKKRVNKSTFDKYNRNPSKYSSELKRLLYCSVCNHIPFPRYNEQCKCPVCSKQRQLKREQRIREEMELAKTRAEIVRDVFDIEDIPVQYDDLSFLNKVYLGALILGLVSEDLYCVPPRINCNIKLAPVDVWNDSDGCGSLDSLIYRTLHNHHVINVDPNSDIDSFVFDEDNYPQSFYTFRVGYHLNLEYPENKYDLYHKILSPRFYDESNITNAFDLWKTIAMAECVEYLLYQIKRVGWSFTPGEKTRVVINELLEEFSVSEIYAIIYSSVTYACRLYEERKMGKKQAANTVVSICRTTADKIRDGKWERRSYGRIKEAPQSILSSYYFDSVLKIGEKGFTNPPNYEDLRAVLDIRTDDSGAKDDEENR